MLKTFRQATGPDSARAAYAIKQALDRRDAWPYPHVYPPWNSERRNPTGYITAPAAGAANQATILTFTVPSGYWFYLDRLGLFFTGQVWTFGDFLFSVDKNTPLGGGTYQGVPLTDLQNIGFTFGSVAVGPVKLDRCELFAPDDVIRAKIINVNIGAPGANAFGAWFGGWLIPTVDVPHAE